MTAAVDGHRGHELAVRVVSELTRRGMTIAVAESLTGGLVVAELVSVPGASAVVRGGVVAYATELKSSLLGVDAELLAQNGPIDSEVARQMVLPVPTKNSSSVEGATDGASTRCRLMEIGCVTEFPRRVLRRLRT